MHLNSTKIFITTCALLGAQFSIGQQLKGKVVTTNAEGRESPLPGAQLLWQGTTIGTTTNSEGFYSLDLPSEFPAMLLTKYVGYRTDSVRYSTAPTSHQHIVLKEGQQLKTVEIVERLQGTQLSTRNTFNSELISQKELKRAACCDLSESFETNATVDVSYSDAVTGTKAIKMMGLDGKYAQISVENIPFVRGLSTAYGLTLIPGTWINSVNVSKGSGPVINGTSTMTGQIDLGLLKPEGQPPVFVNIYGNEQGRTEANVHVANDVGKNWKSLLLVHGNLQNNEVDRNSDGFLDAPITQRINVLNRWETHKDGKHGQIGWRYVYDDRTGGQTGFTRGEQQQATLRYGTNINNRMVDVFGKRGWVFKNDPTKSIGIIGALRHHDVNTFFGERTYVGTEQSGYANLIYQQLLGKGNDQFKAGVSMLYDDFEEAYNDSAFSRTETAPGMFAEYTLKRGAFTAVAGVRADHHQPFGTFVSPRLHLKYDLGPLTALRLSGGKAYRSPNLFVENTGYLVSSREVIVESTPQAEESWNGGVSLLHKFKWLDRKWAFNFDVYRTQFEKQLVTDLEDPDQVRFYMSEKTSFANTVQVDVQIELTKVLDMKLSYRFYDSKTTYKHQLLATPFVPVHRGLIDFGYASRNEKWRGDISLNLFGNARLPRSTGTRDDLQLTSFSPQYATVFTQVTRIMGPLEVYVGVENLTDYIQQEQIRGADDPFGPNFDASQIWGPVNRRMVYGGLRFTIDKKNNEPKEYP